MSQSGCTADTTEPYALCVIGDTMLPEFEDGNIIIVDPGMHLYHTAFVVVDYGGEVIFSQYLIEGNRQWLEQLNQPHSRIELNTPFELKGVVVQKSNGRRKSLKHYAAPDS